MNTTPVHIAVHNGDAEKLLDLLEKGYSPSDPAGGHTPLAHAAFLGEIACGKILIDHGARIEELGDPELFTSTERELRVYARQQFDRVL
ncbi:MAG: ankyrin repeat domain-containing protein [Proteobacteria bacterium]|nr:ankyrin repeat domain-containing protein [Pseudomonadota bacterium]